MNSTQQPQKLLPPGNPYRKQFGDVQMLWHKRDEGKNVFGVERFVLLFLSIALMLMPTMLVRWLSGLGGYAARKIAMDLWTLFKPSYLLCVLVSGWWSHTWSVWLTGILLVDLLLYISGLVLLRDFWTAPAAYSRSLILLGINLFEFAIAFAIFYLHWSVLTSNGVIVSDWNAALYFSIVTTTTLGCGDITPSVGLGRTFVITQNVVSIAFMAVIIARFVGNLDRDRAPINEDY